MSKLMTKTRRLDVSQKLSPLAYDIGGILLIAIGALLFFGLVGVTKGVIITHLARGLQLAIGVGSYLFAAALMGLGVGLVARKDALALPAVLVGWGALLWALVTALHLHVPSPQAFLPDRLIQHGGYLGAVTAWLLRETFGEWGSVIVLLSLTLISFLIVTRKSLTDLITIIVVWQSQWVRTLFHDRIQRRWKSRGPAKRSRKERKPALASGQKGEESIPTVPEGGYLQGRGSEGKEDQSPYPTEDPTPPTGKRKGSPSFALLPGHYEKVIEVLDPPRPDDNPETMTGVEEGIRLVEETLASFKIEAKVVNVKRGPVITRYEVQLAPGIRVKRIENLADDLALSLAAIGVRVEAPVPGKSVIGIEVPNRRIALVRLRELLGLDEFKKAPSKLTFALGKDIAGVPKLADLSKMPHLLIGGATNSGKSVCLNSLIVSILARAHPDEVKLSLIDPKRVELTLFNGVPHLLHPVVVDAKGAARALRCAIKEMERRYRLFAEKGVRHIESYNEALKEDEDAERLPHIVIVIDELADLMAQAGSEFEKLICRIAQLARATGIHLVVATQRPSVNVITGLIKANIPSRIAFAVASQTDSRVILDTNGAERLIGRGDMLFLPVDAPKPIRIQGAFISEQEVHRVVEVLINEYGMPDDFPFDVYGEGDEEAQLIGVRLGKKDPLFDRAVEIVRRKGYASASLLQRELEIGYPRAGKLIDQLEKAGIIGPAEGNKPRKILIPFVDEPLNSSDGGEGAD